MNFKSSLIPVLDIYITGKCNFRCPYCFGEETKNDDISIQLFNKVLDFCSHYNITLGLTGGEPLLHKNFRELVTLSKTKQVPLILRTNGMLLKEYLDILNQFEWIGISLDGIDDVNNQLRPNANNYSYTAEEKLKIPLENIKLIKNEYPSQKILLASLASSLNTNSLLNLAKILSINKIPIDRWKIYQFTRNNFRSIFASYKYEIELKLLEKLETDIPSIYKGELIIKKGEGNCFIIDTLGSIRVNNEIIGSIDETYTDLITKMLNVGVYTKLINNKNSTYNV